jgi:malonate-semialdehyde dehydrogenase (acetylating)/methylmalonate-semialdehyde dehydrogenase
MSATSTLTHSLPADRKLREVHHWVNGRTLTGSSGRFGDVYNPASGEVQARVGLATVAEVDSAVAAAAAAFPEWSAQPGLRRARVMFRVREIY